jgi:hypothetical protein
MALQDNHPSDLLNMTIVAPKVHCRWHDQHHDMLAVLVSLAEN